MGLAEQKFEEFKRKVKAKRERLFALKRPIYLTKMFLVAPENKRAEFIISLMFIEAWITPPPNIESIWQVQMPLEQVLALNEKSHPTPSELRGYYTLFEIAEFLVSCKNLEEFAEIREIYPLPAIKMAIEKYKWLVKDSPVSAEIEPGLRFVQLPKIPEKVEPNLTKFSMGERVKFPEWKGEHPVITKIERENILLKSEYGSKWVLGSDIEKL